MNVILRYEELDNIEVFVDDSSRGYLKNLNQEINSRVKRNPASLQPPLVTGGQLFERKSGVS
jgi:hypothetical protein